MKKIKILFCIEYLSYGGTEKQLISLIGGLDKNRFQPYLCCLRKSIIGEDRKDLAVNLFDKMECSKIQLDFVSFKSPKSWLEIFRLIKFIRRNKINIVQTYFQDPAVVGVVAAKLSGVKHIVACFRDLGFWRKDDNDIKMRIIYKLFSAYIANSIAVRNFYMNLYQLPIDKFHIIYNGIDTDLYKSSRNHKNNHTIIGIVANLNRPVKRVDVFLRAAGIVLQKIGGIKFIVAGEGEIKQSLIQLTDELGISDYVEFLGRVENIPQLLSNIDIGVITSDSEGFSNSILEYMASDTLVVATAVGGNVEIIKNNINGFCIPPGDFYSLSEKIIEIIQNKETFFDIRKKAFLTISTQYTIKICLNNYQKLYEKIVQFI